MASKVLFDRKWKIVLNVRDKTKTIKDLKVTFNIKNTLLGDPSLATFQIYNINEETEAMITDNDCIISFHTSYFSDDEDTWNVLFQGEITNSYEIRQQTDIIWNVWARDGFSLLNKNHPTIASIQNPTSPKTILESLVSNAIGLIGTPTYVNNCDIKLSSADPLDEFVATETFSGEFTDILEPYGLGWQVQGDELVVFDKEFTDPNNIEGETIKVSRETGLLTIPLVDYKGVTFTHLLDGRFKPTKIINIEPNTTKYNLGNDFYVKRYDKTKWRSRGKFRIFEVTHRGDTRGDKWDTEVIAFYRRN
jgi:hypothetical protein